MLRAFALLALAAIALAAAPAQDAQSILHPQRSSPGDLELGGDLAGLPAGTTRYIRYDDLLRLRQESYVVADDSNFAHGTRISGVALAELARRFAASPEQALIVAICDDAYRANYPRDYIAAHHPILILRMNGQLRDRWPKSEDGGSLGPYLVSHPFFRPSFKVLSHDDEPQIPYGVVRIEFRNESVVFGAIHPPGNWPAGSPVALGYIIARQDCFRCHNMGAEGGTKSGQSWLKLAEDARDDGPRFRQTIRNPSAVTPGAKMPAQPGYNNATLDALTAYFKAFANRDPHPEKNPRP